MESFIYNEALSRKIKNGKQGLVGLFSLKKDPTHNYIFKLSQYINFLVEHETVVMSSLNELSPFCPHFCKFVDQFTTLVDPVSRKSTGGGTSNPFDIRSKYPIQQEILVCEFLEGAQSLCKYIFSPRVPDEVIFSLVKQTLMGVLIAQKHKRFTHYDLHSMNVMVNHCSPDTVFLYVLDKHNQFCVPTYGKYPVIIDFGFSYIQDMEDGPLWPSLGHTHVGFTSYQYDPFSDLKLFLLSVSEEIKKRGSKKAKRFRKLIKNIFKSIQVDRRCGWDKNRERPITDKVLSLFHPYCRRSILFTDYEQYTLDIIQTLIILPVEKQDYTKLGSSLTSWMKEWTKIEEMISSPFYNLYILKGLVNAARQVHADYLDPECRKKAVAVFKRQVNEKVAEVSQFLVLKHIHFERMLCSLFIVSKCLEGLIYKFVQAHNERKNRDYQKLPVRNVEEVYALLETRGMEDTSYEFTSKTRVYVFDCVEKKTYTMTHLPSNTLDQVNRSSSLCKGACLYEAYQELDEKPGQKTDHV